MKEIPIFSSDASIGKGATLNTDDAIKIDQSKSVSIFAICDKYDIDPIYILDNSFVSFITCYKNAQKLKRHLVFGVKLFVTTDAKDQSETSLSTVSRINVWMKNSDGYKDLIKLYSATNGNPETFYYYGRTDWKSLKRLVTKNLVVTVPFYSGFIGRNVLNFGHRAVPEWGSINPIFMLESHEMPFDALISNKTLEYCKQNNFESINTHTTYYYQDVDAKAHQIFKCANERTTFQKPNMAHFCQNTFSFESYLRKHNEKIT